VAGTTESLPTLGSLENLNRCIVVRRVIEHIATLGSFIQTVFVERFFDGIRYILAGVSTLNLWESQQTRFAIPGIGDEVCHYALQADFAVVGRPPIEGEVNWINQVRKHHRDLYALSPV
jgi:hypothetical protein